MDPIVWTEEFSVGVDEMDRQHRVLIDLINRLVTHDKNSEAETVSDILNELNDYIALHFKQEEAMLEKAGFPQLEQHKIEHVSLIEQFSDILMQTMKNPESTSADLLELLLHWLKGHILHDDMAYRDFFKNQI